MSVCLFVCLRFYQPQKSNINKDNHKKDSHNKEDNNKKKFFFQKKSGNGDLHKSPGNKVDP